MVSYLLKVKGSWIDVTIEIVEVPVPTLQASKLVVDQAEESGPVNGVLMPRYLGEHAGKEVNVLHLVVHPL